MVRRAVDSEDKSAGWGIVGSAEERLGVGVCTLEEDIVIIFEAAVEIDDWEAVASVGEDFEIAALRVGRVTVTIRTLEAAAPRGVGEPVKRTTLEG